MIRDGLSLLVVTVIVVIDNALLAGLLLPRVDKRTKVHLSILVAGAVAISQVAMALMSKQLLQQDVFRYAAMAVLVFMAIQTLKPESALRGFSLWRAFWKVFIFTAVGNIDNMIWLGVEMGRGTMLLVFLSLITIPLFVAVSVLFSYECERHRWIILLGSGMPIWAAVTLFLHSQLGHQWLPNPSVALRIGIAAAMVVAAFVSSQLLYRRRLRL